MVASDSPWGALDLLTAAGWAGRDHHPAGSLHPPIHRWAHMAPRGCTPPTKGTPTPLPTLARPTSPPAPHCAGALRQCGPRGQCGPCGHGEVGRLGCGWSRGSPKGLDVVSGARWGPPPPLQSCLRTRAPQQEGGWVSSRRPHSGTGAALRPQSAAHPSHHQGWPDLANT